MSEAAAATNNTAATETPNPNPETPATSTETPLQVTPSETPTETPPASETPEAKPEETPAVPEKYDLIVPEGSPLTAKDLEAFSAFAKEKGLTQEQAQERLEERHTALSEFAKAQVEQYQAKARGWAEEIKADKELGGLAFDENAAIVAQAIEATASPGLKQMLTETGLGNHPEVYRHFLTLGKRMISTPLVHGGAGAAVEKPIEEIFYPKQNT